MTLCNPGSRSFKAPHANAVFFRANFEAILRWRHDPRCVSGYFSLDDDYLSRQRRLPALRFHDWIQQLHPPAFRSVVEIVLEADARWITPGDFGGTEQHVPEKKQIAVVAFVVADAVVLRDCVVGEMRGRGRDRAFDDPR